MITRWVFRPSSAVLIGYNALMALLLERHFQNDHRVCMGLAGACSAIFRAAHNGFIVWSIVCGIGDLLLIATWLALGTTMDPRLSHHEITSVPASKPPPRRYRDPGLFYPTMSEDLRTSYNATNEDLRS